MAKATKNSSSKSKGHRTGSNAPDAAVVTPAENATTQDKSTKGKPATGKGKTGKGQASKTPKTGSKAKAGDKTPSGMDAFKSLLGPISSIGQDELIASLVEQSTATESTAHAYISWAKREKNPFGFRLEVVKAKDGTKTLKKAK